MYLKLINRDIEIKKVKKYKYKQSRTFFFNKSLFIDDILKKKINNKLKIEIEKIANEDKAYIAGFLDGGGSLLTQIVKGKYKYGFSFRYRIQFVQHKRNHSIMLWLKSKLKVGNIRLRKDGISEYAITGKYAVCLIIKVLLPFLKIKKELGFLILTIIDAEFKVDSKSSFLKVCELVDLTKDYTYSKRRKITASIVKQYFDSP